MEDALVQIMTYLVENEMAALIVPSRFLAQLHPHFREVMQVLAIQAAVQVWSPDAVRIYAQAAAAQ